MKFMRNCIIVLVSLFMLTGCETMGEKEKVSTAVGAVAGGVVGSRFGHGAGRWAGAAIGSILGGLLGNTIGKDMDERDHIQSDKAFNESTNAQVGKTTYWHNDSTGNSGTYRTVRDGQSSDGHYCREFVTTANINGHNERLYGTACKQSDGSWQVVR